jgi:Peptidase family C25
MLTLTTKAVIMKLKKLTLVLVGIALMLNQVSDAQQIVRENKGRFPRHELRWSEPAATQFTETEVRHFLSFDGALYDPDKEFLPYYFHREQLPAGMNSGSAQLLNPSYAPATAAEVQVINNFGRSFLTTDAEVVTRIDVERKVPHIAVMIYPLRINAATGQIEKLVSFDLQIQASYSAERTLRSRSYATTSVLASGTWFKIGVTNTGIHRINKTLMTSLGIDIDNIDPRNIRIYGNGQGQLPFSNNAPHYDDLHEYAIMVQGESDGVFDANDAVLFYGVSPNTWKYNSIDSTFAHQVHNYSDTTYYFLNVDLGPGKRIAAQASSSLPSTHTVNTFNDYQYHESDSKNLIKSGREWYGEEFNIINNYSFSFTFPNIVSTSRVNVKVDMVSRYETVHNYSVTAQNTTQVISVNGAQTQCYYCCYALAGKADFDFLPAGPVVSVNVARQLNTSPAPLGYLNWIEVNVRRQLRMSGNQMSFRDVESVGVGNVGQFTLSGVSPNVVVWDVTDLENVFLQQGTLSGNDFSWTQQTDSLREYIAFDGSSYFTPVAHGAVSNQNLHAMEPAEFIIITHPSFMAQAQELALLHEQHDSLTYLIVTPQQIYNEFSAGAQDVTAIRDFIRMLYERADSPDEMPRYVLLFGDGSYDNKRRLPNNTNMIPTFQNRNSLCFTESYVADEFYCLLDDSGEWDTGSDIGAMDVSIGRFPVSSVSEAQNMVNKVRQYITKTPPNTSPAACLADGCSKGGEWQSWITFIGDDEDSNIHMSQSDQLAAIVDTAYHAYNIEKIYLDAYQQEQTPGGERYPQVNEAFDKRMEKGCLILNYTGHGGEVGLAHERILEVGQINAWDNKCNMPLFVTATCEFSRFDDPGRVSAGEYVLLNPNGGGIGLLTTVRLVYSTPNFILNRNFYFVVFESENGEQPHIGDIYRKTKVLSGYSTNNRNFTLLGDPALKLNYPTYTVATTHINNVPVSSNADTIRALSRVTIKGMVTDSLGNKINNYNGVLYPTVFDKVSTVTTLQNDPPISAFTFKTQRNVIYKGKVNVVNGDFEFTFVVPRDIQFQFGAGRISYFAENGVSDASGAYENIVVGGSDPNATADGTGAQVRLFLNDSNFVAGGMTDASPKLFAMIFDSSGVNTVGNGIGHDILAVLDEETDNAVVLNDYYQANLNSYQSGTVLYPYNKLSEGPHTLSLKVWDVYNNSSTAKTDFVVSSSATLALAHVLNYPNPFTTNTAFYFEHNQACSEFNVTIQVFTVSGKLVKTINEPVHTTGYRSPAITWDGRDDYGDPIGRGTYIYKVFVRSADGQTAEQYEKLVILN